MRLLIAILAVALSTVQAGAQITVAAAADLNPVLAELASAFQKQTGTEVKLSFGASGNLFTQIKNGAPFDLFFSADESYPQQLIDAKLADGASLYRYAVGRLVLWAPASSTLDVEHRGFDVLLDPSVKKIAMANPQHAPYGRAAEAALKHSGLYEKVADRLVLGENISQTAQFVESGNAQVGFVALSHAVAPAMQGKGKYWMIPQDAYPPLNQAVVIVSNSSQKKDVAVFLEYVKTAPAVELLKRYGFSVPEEKR